jgi:hypothetical protein
VQEYLPEDHETSVYGLFEKLAPDATAVRVLDREVPTTL